jgi:hypothetical protein
MTPRARKRAGRQHAFGEHSDSCKVCKVQRLARQGECTGVIRDPRIPIKGWGRETDKALAVNSARLAVVRAAVRWAKGYGEDGWRDYESMTRCNQALARAAARLRKLEGRGGK